MAINLGERWGQLSDRLGKSTPVMRFRTMYESLSPRDRRLFVGLVLSAVVLVGASGVLSGQKYLRRLEQENQRLQEHLTRVLQVRVEQETLKQQIEAIEAELRSNPDFNLTSFLERGANELQFPQPVNIQTRGDSLKEGFREQTVDVKVRKAPLDKIVRYLHEIESAPQRMTVNNLRIRTNFRAKAELDADLEVTVLMPEEG